MEKDFPMKKKIFLTILPVLLIASCDEAARRDETDPGMTIKETEVETPDISSIKNILIDSLPPDTSDLTTISEKAAVFTMPDTALIKNMIEKDGEEDFYSSSDDSLFKQNAAADLLQTKGVRIVYPKTRYLLFKGNDQDFYIDTQKSQKLSWISLFFQPDKAPEVFDPANAEQGYLEYFEN